MLNEEGDLRRHSRGAEAKTIARALRGLAAAAMIAATLPFCATASECDGLVPIAFPRSSLTIDTAAGPKKIQIELAATETERARGLMCRQSLGPDDGMLFDFGTVGEVSMWMRNTLIPLDMVFIRKDGTVARIGKRTVPLSLAVVSSGEPILGVLELNAGTADRLGIKPGDRVRHEIFKPAR